MGMALCDLLSANLHQLKSDTLRNPGIVKLHLIRRMSVLNDQIKTSWGVNDLTDAQVCAIISTRIAKLDKKIQATDHTFDRKERDYIDKFLPKTFTYMIIREITMTIIANHTATKLGTFSGTLKNTTMVGSTPGRSIKPPNLCFDCMMVIHCVSKINNRNIH